MVKSFKRVAVVASDGELLEISTPNGAMAFLETWNSNPRLVSRAARIVPVTIQIDGATVPEKGPVWLVPQEQA